MKTWNRLLSTAATLCLLTACVITLSLSTVYAQNTVSSYTITTPGLGWNDISGTGTLLYGEVFRYYEGSITTSLPFDLKYDGGTISANTTIYIFNATIGLGTEMSYGYTDGGLGDASFTNCLFPWGAPYVQMGDHAYNTSSYDGAVENFGIYEEVSGSSPNRVYTIQLNGVHTGWQSLWTSASAISSMQVKMYESTGVIQFLYQNHGTYMAGNFNAAIGINGGSNFTSKSALSNTSLTPSSDIQFTPPVPPGEFSLQSKTLNFGGVATGQSQTQTTTLTALGPSPITIRSTSLTGSSDYTILNPITNGTVMQMGSTYTFQLKFTPTSTGARNATFTVVTDAADSATQVVFLNGSGLAPLVQYTFLPYNGITYPYNTLFHHVALHFGDSLTECFGVQNTGQAPLNFNNVSFSGLQANMYRVVHMPPNPLPAGASDSICVRFQPYLEGRPDAQLAINTNAFNTPNDTVLLFGTGKLAHLVVTPQEGNTGTGTTNGSLSFDSVAIGDSVCKTLTLHNTGTDTLYITKQIVTYGDYDFHFYPLTGKDTMLVPDASKLVNVCFVPIASGARFASIRFYTTIPKTYPDKRDTSQVLVQVGGTGVPFGRLAVTGMVTDSAIVGSTKCIFDTIRNTGSSDLTITKVKVSGTNAASFTLSGITTPTVIPMGGFVPVQLCFAPTERGLANASLDVTGTTSGRTLNQSLPILGIGQKPCMDAAPNPVAFGSVAFPNVTLAKTGHDTTCITVTNCGDLAMSFTGTLTAGTSSAYLLTTSSTPLIAAGATGTICIAYSPDTLGASNGSVTITPSESSLAAITLPLNGTGAGVLVTPSGQPATTSIGGCDTFDVTLQNNGNMAWAPGTPTISGSNDFTVVGAVTPASIAPATSGTIKISYCPTSSGNTTGQLNFNAATPMALAGVPYQLNGVASSSGVAMRTEQDGFAIGASYPNPTANSANVIVTMPHDAKVTVTLVRVDGAAVATVFDGSLAEGQHVLTIDAKDVTSGTYFCMLQSGTVRLIREIVVTH